MNIEHEVWGPKPVGTPVLDRGPAVRASPTLYTIIYIRSLILFKKYKILSLLHLNSIQFCFILSS
jgi:hypothetical protein